MPINELYQIIDQQIFSNRGRNLFHGKDPDILSLAPSTRYSWKRFSRLPKEERECLINYTTDKTLQELCRINQYYAFPVQAKLWLKDIYARLLEGIRNGLSPERLIPEHYRDIRSWLSETNHFARTIYAEKGTLLEPVVCETYTVSLQVEILHLDIASLKEPVLDLGCGKEGLLVRFLRSQGIEAFGLERFSGKDPYVINEGWLEFDYGKEKWGSVISHLGFSNHFRHHHLRKDGNIRGYSETYMAILHALKKDGLFYYAPDLPFIEPYLPSDRFRVTQYPVGRLPYRATHVQKNK